MLELIVPVPAPPSASLAAAHTFETVHGCADLVRLHVRGPDGASALPPATAARTFPLTVRKRPGDDVRLTVLGVRNPAAGADVLDFAIDTSHLPPGRYLWDAWLVDVGSPFVPAVPGVGGSPAIPATPAYTQVYVPASPFVVLASVR